MARMRMLMLALGHYLQARHGQIELNVLWYYTMMCSVIVCTARHGQIVFTGVVHRSSLAQRGMATMRMLVLVLGHYLQGKAWPD